MLSSYVCPSVCLSPVGLLQRWLIVESHKQRHTNDTIAQGLSAKFQRDHPQRGRQTEVGYVQIADFRPISCYISEMVQNRDIVTLEG